MNLDRKPNSKPNITSPIQQMYKNEKKVTMMKYNLFHKFKADSLFKIN